MSEGVWASGSKGESSDVQGVREAEGEGLGAEVRMEERARARVREAAGWGPNLGSILYKFCVLY